MICSRSQPMPAPFGDSLAADDTRRAAQEAEKGGWL